MSKKTRLIILSVCAVLFFIITPYIILYSLGYRIDFEKRKIVATGGLYIKALPQGADVIIDSKINNKISILSNYVFVQNLLPKQHSVLVKKDGYYDYQKNLDVKENEVTKLEHVILFKKNIAFEIVKDKTQSPFDQKTTQDKFIIKNNNLYYSNIQENVNLSQNQKNTPVIKNIIEYIVSNNNIIWLALDGFLYSSDLNGKNVEKLSQISIKIKQKNLYQLTVFSQNIFLKENNNLLLFNKDTKSFRNFYSPVNDLKISPTGQKILYFNNHEILFSNINQENPDKIFLNRFSEKINDFYWLNDNYLIFTLENKIFISETDNRDNINTINLPQTISLPDGKNPSTSSGQIIDIKNPKIFFDQQDKKLYILTQGNLLASEKLIP